MTARPGVGDGVARAARRRRWARRLAVVVAAAVALVAAMATFVPAGRLAFRTLLFMPDLMPPVAARPLTWVTTDPAREAVRIVDATTPTAAGWAADVYVPHGRRPFPAIIVSLGINQAARDDPRVRKLGDGLSRLGFIVLIPANDDLRAERLTPDAVAMLVAAFHQLSARTDVDPARIGYFGVCVGASLALLAAEDGAIADDVAWVAWFGGYYRLDTLIAAVVGRAQPGAAAADCASGVDCGPAAVPRPWPVDATSERVIRRHLHELADLVDAPTDRAAVAALADEAVTYGGAMTALEGLSTAARGRLAALSPATHLADLRAPLFTMSDVGDPLIPFTETVALNHDAARLGRLTRARTFDVFSHVNLDPFNDPGHTLPEVWRLFRHVHAIVAPALLN